MFHAYKSQITNNAKFFLAIYIYEYFIYIVGIFIFISREIFMLSLIGREKSFITSGPFLIMKTAHHLRLFNLQYLANY